MGTPVVVFPCSRQISPVNPMLFGAGTICFALNGKNDRS